MAEFDTKRLPVERIAEAPDRRGYNRPTGSLRRAIQRQTRGLHAGRSVNQIAHEVPCLCSLNS